MAFQVSPGINVSEKDITAVVTSVSTTEAGIAGVFNWGPVDQVTLVTDEVDLVRKFGKPSNQNGETWFTAANFLSYGNALHVVRAIETGNANTSLNTTSAYAAVGNVSVLPLVRNDEDYADQTFDANVMYVAKYPAELGNTLKVSICDSVNAFSSTIAVTDAGVVNSSINFVAGSANVTVAIQGANGANANTAASNFAAKLTVGDYLTVGNTSTGTQEVQIASIGTPVVAGSNSTLAITLNSPVVLGSNYASSSVVRSWEYANLFDRAPGASKTMTDLNLDVVDEVHIVVIDEDGRLTGTPGNVLEPFAALSRATDAKTESGQGNYYKSILNATSQYVWWAHDRQGAASAEARSLVNSANQTPLNISFIGGQDGATEATIPLGKLTLAYDKFKDTGDVDVSILMQGKARGLSPDSDTTPSSNSVNYSTLANYIISNVAESRLDLIVTTSPAKADVTAAADKASAVVAYRTNMAVASSYGEMDSGYKYQYDKYNDVFRWVPLNGDVAGCMVRTDFQRDPWWSPAGQERGQIKNVVKLAWNPNKAERDIIYKAGINPVITEKASGTYLNGDKTLIGRSSAFDRINVRRLFITLEKAIANYSKFAMFEFNDYFTRSRFTNMVNPYLADVRGRRGVTDYLVVCDETNNTPQVIDTNGFVGDIYIKANRSINFIQLNFINTPTGVQFTEIVGQV